MIPLAHHTPNGRGLGRVLTPTSVAETSVGWPDPYAGATCRKTDVDMLSDGGSDVDYYQLRLRQRGACRVCPAFDHCMNEALREPPWLFSGVRAGMDSATHRWRWEQLHPTAATPAWFKPEFQ